MQIYAVALRRKPLCTHTEAPEYDYTVELSLLGENTHILSFVSLGRFVASVQPSHVFGDTEIRSHSPRQSLWPTSSHPSARSGFLFTSGGY